MRELTRSLFSYGWAMSMFGVQQIVNLVTPSKPGQPNPAKEAFDHVTAATANELGDGLRQTFHAGDQMQKQMIDMMFAPLMGGCDAGGLIRKGAEMMNRGTDTVRHAFSPAGNGQSSTGPASAARPSGSAPPRPSAGSTQQPPAEPQNQADEGWGPMPR
jgi:hypothetical protein